MLESHRQRIDRAGSHHPALDQPSEPDGG